MIGTECIVKSIVDIIFHKRIRVLEKQQQQTKKELKKMGVQFAEDCTEYPSYWTSLR